MRIPKACLLLALGLALAGCEPPRISSDDLPDRIYSRVVSLSPSTTELIGLIDCESYLLGRTAFCTVPSSVRNTTIVANPEPDFERIANLQPDLIVADSSVMNPAWEEKLRRIGAEVKVVDIHSLEEWKRAVYDLASGFLRQRTASKRIGDVEQVEAMWRSDPLDPKPTAIVVMNGQQPRVAGLGTFQADLLRAAGAQPLGPDSPRFEQVSPDQVLAWDPQIIIVAGDPNELTGVPWDSTEAGTTNSIVGINPDVLLRSGGRVDVALDALGTEIRKRVRAKR
ncbi:MAG: hypothetical protein C4341_00530 [Armatimonadota bacterium]